MYQYYIGYWAILQIFIYLSVLVDLMFLLQSCFLNPHDIYLSKLSCEKE